MSALVLTQYQGNEITAATRAAVSAAKQAAGEVHLLVCGHQVDAVAAAAAQVDGVSKVLVADAVHMQHALAEDVAAVVVALAPSYGHLVAPATSFGKDVLPRAAALLGIAQVSDVVKVLGADRFVHPVYAGNAMQSVQVSGEKIAFTVRSTAFDKAGQGASAAPIEQVNVPAPSGLSQFVSASVTRSERPELTSARVVVSGGRGVGSKENFAVVEALADKLGAAVGASRAAVDAGYISNDHQVGQTGKVVAPELYLALGISGAIQHLAGMKDSKVIVAVNKDENAPIFEVADYGLVADLFEVAKELTEKL